METGSGIWWLMVYAVSIELWAFAIFKRLPSRLFDVCYSGFKARRRQRSLCRLFDYSAEHNACRLRGRL